MDQGRRLVRSTAAALAVAAAVFIGFAPGAGALSAGSAEPTYPTLDLGMSGLNVAAFEHLAYSGWLMPNEDDVFDDYEHLLTKALQNQIGQPATGVVGPRIWPRFTPIGPGSPQANVKAVQTLLGKVGHDAPTTGHYGLNERVMVWWFQASVGLPQTAEVDETTWRHLLWHYQELPHGPAALPGVCPTDPNNNWVDAAVWSYLARAGQALTDAGLPPLGITDASKKHGGQLGTHDSHQVGLDVDIRPISTNTTGCPGPRNIAANPDNPEYDKEESSHTTAPCVEWDERASHYDWERTKLQILALIDASRASGLGRHHVLKIFFNDCELQKVVNHIQDDLMTPAWGHYDHWHIRFCEPAPSRLEPATKSPEEPASRYRCKAPQEN